MEITIKTRKIPATDTRGAAVRASATVEGKRRSLRIPYPHEARSAHREVAVRFAAKHLPGASVVEDPVRQHRTGNFYTVK